MSYASRGQLLQLPMDEAIIMTVSNCWIDISSLACSYLLDRELRLNLNIPCLLRPWVGGVYLYPFILHVALHLQPYPSSLGTFFS